VKRLGGRANLQALSVGEKDLILYEDHRSLVFVLWHALNVVEPPLAEPPTLVYFDHHDDAKAPSAPVRAIFNNLRSAGTDRGVMEAVEWDLSSLDDDWLIAAMELGVLKDAICVGADITPNLGQFHTQVTDHTGGVHNIFKIGHLWDALAHQGPLVDQAQAGQYQPLWTSLGWAPTEYPEPRTPGNPPLIVDFDLDYFSYHLLGQTLTWPNGMFDKKLGSISQSTYARGLRARTFFGWLLSEASFLTVARESPYCGGTLGSEQALQNLMDLYRELL